MTSHDLTTAREVFALFLQAQRVKRGWSVNRTAKKLGVNASSIRAVENRRKCSKATLLKILKFSQTQDTWIAPFIIEKELENATV